ncbi:MAG: carboxypeptidase-like regulatory domain-containing protein [Fuerstiella sp.]
MRTQVTWMIALTLVTSPAITYGADNTRAASEEKLELRNVELNAADSLEGHLLTQTGQPVANTPILVRSQANLQKVAQQVTTDADGRFFVTSLSSGTCVMEAGDETYAVRVWTKGTAPPRSLQNVAFVKQSGDTAVRGNAFTNNRLTNWVRNLTPKQKIALGVLTAAAIVIPIAVDDDDKPNGS